MSKFDYIFNKIKNSEFAVSPFKHIYLEDLFSEEDFAKIIGAPEVNLNEFNSTSELISGLKEHGYEIITFPGTTTDEKEYLSWYESKDKRTHGNANTCEGFGITFRLKKYQSEFLNEVNSFFQSKEMMEMLCAKFGLDAGNQKIEGGFQKYLDGYEISPHPDIRKKSLTWMINVNPMQDSEHLQIHTDYMKFTDQFSYVKHFWKGNVNIERCWVPWEWTERESTQRKNNSMVIFSPDCDTLHAVKLDYNHLSGQRTQIYGNLWAKELDQPTACWWDDLVITPKQNDSISRKIWLATPDSVRRVVRKFRG